MTPRRLTQIPMAAGRPVRMPPNIVGILIDKGISFFAGVMITLYGLGFIGRKAVKGSGGAGRHERLASVAIWAGPALIALSVILLLIDLMGALK